MYHHTADDNFIWWDSTAAPANSSRSRRETRSSVLRRNTGCSQSQAVSSCLLLPWWLSKMKSGLWMNSLKYDTFHKMISSDKMLAINMQFIVKRIKVLKDTLVVHRGSNKRWMGTASPNMCCRVLLPLSAENRAQLPGSFRASLSSLYFFTFIRSFLPSYTIPLSASTVWWPSHFFFCNCQFIFSAVSSALPFMQFPMPHGGCTQLSHCPAYDT